MQPPLRFKLVPWSLVTAPDGGRRSIRGCSIASRRDEPFSNTCRSGYEHPCDTCDRSRPGSPTMTPPNPSHRQNKIFAAAADGQPTAEQDTDHSDEHSDPDSDPDSTVLVHTSRLHDRVVYHEIGTDGRPLCNTGGEFTLVSRADAREHTNGRCNVCTRVHTGRADHRPCPHCGQSIATTRWPQHVRSCSGPHQCNLQSETFRDGEANNQQTEASENRGGKL